MSSPAPRSPIPHDVQDAALAGSASDAGEGVMERVSEHELAVRTASPETERALTRLVAAGDVAAYEWNEVGPEGSPVSRGATVLRFGQGAEPDEIREYGRGGRQPT